MQVLSSENKKKITPFPIVVIGASKAIDVFNDIINFISPKSGLAYILILNSQENDSKKIIEQIKKVSSVPIKLLDDYVPLEQNKIYLVQDNKILKNKNHIIEIAAQHANNANPIDISFTSIAEVYEKSVIGILMPNIGIEGQKGLKEIKKNGGFTIVATNNLKNRADVIEAPFVDYILPVEEIKQKLLLLKQNIEFNNTMNAKEEDYFQQIYTTLLLTKKIDFSNYKQSTIRRGIQRRMTAIKSKNKEDYIQYLNQNKIELDNLFNDLLIPVTAFFRDGLLLESVCDIIVPDLLKIKETNSPLKIWVIGCSTGQEAFSLAITLQEFMETHSLDFKFQVFATDISEKSISKAKSGQYLKKEIKGISEARLERFFTKTRTGYQIIKEIRDTCIFACHNLFKDAPFAKIDLISCRNVMIYMDSILQKKAFNLFHYSLNPQGFLLLGKSETTINSSELFLIYDRRNKIYTPNLLPNKKIKFTTNKDKAVNERNKQMNNIKLNDFEKDADQLLLAQYMPSGVIVNEHFTIVQFRGKTDTFLAPSPGKASLNILKMVQEDLAYELKNLLFKVKSTKQTTKKENITSENGAHSISIEAIPLLNTSELFILVLFKEEINTNFFSQNNSNPDNQKDQRIKALEAELSALRKDMHIMHQTQETLNEELFEANEALISDGEELKSLNEELETSTEELLSTNEELMTVNQELFERNNALDSSRNFSDSVIETLHEPLVLLDKKYKILRANQAFYKVFKLKEKDSIGKIIFQLQGDRWNIEDLKRSLKKIQNRKEEIINLETSHNFPSIGWRTICFNMQSIPSETGEPLILLAFEDLTNRIKVEQNATKLKERKTLYDFFMEASGAFCILKGKDHVFEFANPAYCNLIGNKNPIGKRISTILPEIKDQGFIDILDHVFRTGETYIGKETPVSLRQQNEIEQQFYLNFNYKAYTDNSGKIMGILVFAYDITEQILTRKKIIESERRYRHLINSLPIAVYTCDQDGYIKMYNEKAVKLWGKTPQVGKDKWCGNNQVYNSEGAILSINEYPMLKILDGSDLLITELLIEHAHNPKINVINYAKIKKDDNGKIIGAINSLVDITDYKKAIKKMQQNVAMMNEMFESSPAFVCILKGKEYKYDYVNPTYQKLYGNIALMGKTLKEVHPELDNQKIYEILDQVYETATTFVATEMPLFLSRDEGQEPEPVFLNFSYQPIFNLESEVEGIMVFGYNVTRQVVAKLEKDENIKEILEFLPAMIWTNLPNGQINFLNKKWNNYTLLDKIIQNNWGWKKFIHPEDISTTIKAYKKSLATQKPFEIEVRFLRKADNTFRWHIAQGLPIFNQTNEVELWIGIATDIQDQKFKEQKKDEFISIASHEMKTPITTAKAYLQLLEQTPAENIEQSELYKKKAIMSVEKLNSLITELLNISKIQNGKLDLSVDSFDFNELIDNTVEHILFSSPNHKIIKNGIIYSKVKGDKEKLQQVIINLLANAIKYAPNSNKIDIELKEEENLILLAVRDYGIGIDKSNLDKIFDRYYRIDEHSLQFQGLGIGLYISKEIIKLHNGEIWAEGNENGTTFYFKIPKVHKKIKQNGIGKE